MAGMEKYLNKEFILQHKKRIIQVGAVILILIVAIAIYAAGHSDKNDDIDIAQNNNEAPAAVQNEETEEVIIAESPVNIECKVEKIVPLGSHHMFMAKVVNIMVDDDYMEDNGRFALEKTNPLIYSHGGYYETGKKLGTFGYSVRKKKKRKKPNGRKK